MGGGPAWREGGGGGLFVQVTFNRGQCQDAIFKLSHPGRFPNTPTEQSAKATFSS